MAKKKDLIILIPGAKFSKSVWRPFQKIMLSFYWLTHLYHPVYSNYTKNWKRAFIDDKIGCIWLHWGRGITPISRYFAVKRLNRIIKRLHNTRNIFLLGISLGGEIALESSQFFKNNEIKKIVLVCSPNKNIHLNNNKIPIINIFSPFDIFADLSAKILFPLSGGVKLIGNNVKNISLPMISHEQFCDGEKIGSGAYKGIRLPKLVEDLLK